MFGCATSAPNTMRCAGVVCELANRIEIRNYLTVCLNALHEVVDVNTSYAYLCTRENGRGIARRCRKVGLHVDAAAEI